MTRQSDRPGTLLPQDTNFDNADQPGIAQPYSQDEVADLLYGSDRPAHERLARLRELQAESAAREAADLGGADPSALRSEVDRAIEELAGSLDSTDENADFAGLAAPLDTNQDDRLDAIAPDDYDARQAIEQGSTPDAVRREDAEDTEEAAEDLDDTAGKADGQ